MADKPGPSVRGWFAKGSYGVTNRIHVLLFINDIKRVCHIAEAEAYQKRYD